MDPQVAKDAAILTGLGMGATFVILAFLVLATGLMQRVSARIVGRADEVTARKDADARDRALAAAIAVTALLPIPKRRRDAEG